MRKQSSVDGSVCSDQRTCADAASGWHRSRRCAWAQETEQETLADDVASDPPGETIQILFGRDLMFAMLQKRSRCRSRSGDGKYEAQPGGYIRRKDRGAMISRTAWVEDDKRRGGGGPVQADADDEGVSLQKWEKSPKIARGNVERVGRRRAPVESGRQ